MTYSSLLPQLESIARRAGAVIMDVYGQDFAVTNKADNSPVTEADQRAEAVILPELASLIPGVPIIAEEEVAAGRIPNIPNKTFWLVDPLDGTKEFIKRNGEFTVNIGLIENGQPRLGIVFAPALNRLWAGAVPGLAYVVDESGHRQSIACRIAPKSGAVVVSSRSHNNSEPLEKWLSALEAPSIDYAGSSLKFCKVAEGAADYYPRFGPTCEWDIAAAHAVLCAAGGEVVSFEGQPMEYGKPKFLNGNFLAKKHDQIG
jgi:3'(2'), 5'-bisphosphate nucleotidase